MMPEFQDTAVVMKEVHSLFRAENDCATVADTKVLEHSIHEHFEQKEQEIKATIHALTCDIKQQETSPEMEELNTIREKSEWLANEAVSSAQAVKEMEKEQKELEARLQQLSVENEKLVQSEKQLRSETIVDAPKVAHSLSLYKNISRVKWDYDAASMKGVITRRTEVYPFNYPEANYDSINTLWDLIASAG
eukprot:CAMPEP_0174241094 /NCGR_PEP_ID=MMETSP0417-20130205/21766_1 /TAXON_ID=242541 /ORGANISM="Mayorella sp, Strain BSH-02190019" /LENGTH=191 /DNA_ID=CAMNT_0015320289 /DNA_START=59 /DNA_END=630 /DNA_ORIENTATION=-